MTGRSAADLAPHQRSGAHLRLVPEAGGASGVRALVEEAQRAERQGLREAARSLYERALRSLGDGTDAEAGVTASALVRWVARTHQLDGDADAALDCAEAALAIANASGDEAGAGHAINVQAIVHWQRGELDEAERLYLEARACALRSSERKLAAMTALNLGVVANIRGDMQRALRHYEVSLAEYRALGLARDVCAALNNLGMLHTDLGQWEEAERAYDEAKGIASALGDLAALTLIEVNLAEYHVAQGAHDRASDACDRAMEIAERSGDGGALGEAHKIRGVIAREAGELAASEEHFARAEAHAEARQDLLLLAETARERAELHSRQGRNRDTLQCLNRAHRLFSQLRARRDLADVDRRTGRLEEQFLDVVVRWSESIESKDRYTQGHCERVADLACAIAARGGFDAQALFWLRVGALLHDVGKLIVPSEVLNKPGKLTPEEWALLRRHPEAGVEMLADIEFPWDVLPVVESHHEWWDGGGYPRGLAGEAIPLAARIVCIADVYDALTSTRSYKRAMTHEEAVDVMRQKAGSQFDPELWARFESLAREGPPARLSRVTPSRAAPPVPPRAAGSRDAADELTGLPLRRAFLERAGATLSERRDGARPTALLVIDVDHFKLVNDTFGHLRGDEVLRGVVDVLRGDSRPGDFLARYAGDEFVLLLPDTTLGGGAEVAERLRHAVEQWGRQGGGRGAAVTLSVGVAAAPLHGDSAEALFDAADRALYEAKRRGRNAVAVPPDDGGANPRHLRLDRFVGRTRERQRLVQLLDGATQGRPSVVMISGEAGVGKSTLLRQLAPEVRLRGGVMVAGQCHEADVRPPYGPWAEIVDTLRLTGIVPPRPWRELARLVPALAEEPPGADEGSKYALLQELSEYLRLAASVRPLLVVIDDIQWADPCTWDTMEHLLSAIRSDRIQLCLTLRAEERQSVTERRRRLSRDERFVEMALPRLTEEELREWLEVVLGDAGVAAGLVPALHGRSEGNALLAVQLLRTLLDDGLVWHDGERWQWPQAGELPLPIAAGDLIARRLDRVPPRARRVLLTCAVVGRSFDVDLAADACGEPEDEFLDALDEALAAAVVTPVEGSGGQRQAFTHALLAESLRRTCNPRRLRRVHAAVAAAMARRAPHAVAEIAAHYDHAGDGALAHAYAMRAGERAASVFAHADATAHYELAARHAATPDERVESALALAHVAEAAGRYGEAESCASRAVEFTGGAARALAVRARRTRERLRMKQGEQPRRTLEACGALLGEAAAGGLEGEAIALLMMLSQAHGSLGESAEAARLARECVERAAAAGDARLHADALARLGTTLLRDQVPESIELYARAEALYGEAGDRHGQVRCRINVGIAHSLLDRAADAKRAYERAMELARVVAAPDLAGLASLNLGVLQLKVGDHDDARTEFGIALSLFDAARSEPLRLAALYNLAHLAREQRDVAAAADLYGMAAALAQGLGRDDVFAGACAGQGMAALASGDRESATRARRQAAAALGGRQEWWFQGRELLEALVVRLALDGGDARGAARAFAGSHAAAERHDAYAAAWLAAECGPALRLGGDHPAMARCRDFAARHGYLPLLARLTTSAA